MGGNDIIKNSILEKFESENLTVASACLTLGLTILMGLFIYLIYRFNSRNGLYNKDFNKSLAVLPLITSAIMLAMGSNLTISLGMVGALSIVRFRNAIKDPMDLTYLFWCIAVGIITGAGMFALAIVLCLAAAVLISVLDFIPTLKSPCLLVITADTAAAEEAFLEKIKSECKRYKIRSRNIGSKGAEWILELRSSDEAKLVSEISDLDNVNSVHLMTHDGSVRL